MLFKNKVLILVLWFTVLALSTGANLLASAAQEYSGS